MTGIFIKNAAGDLFEKRPEVCQVCHQSLRSDVRIEDHELVNFNVDPDDPHLYNVAEIVNTKLGKRVGWLCGLCCKSWKDNESES